MTSRGSRALVLAAASLFATGGVAIKLTSLTGWQVSVGRSAIAAVLLAVAFPSWRRGWTRSTFAVGLAYGATLMLFVLANKLTTAAHAIFLQGTAPLYVLFLAPRLLGERVRSSDLALAGGLAVGLVLLATSGDPASATAPEPALGNAVAAASGLTWAFAVLGLRGLGRVEASARVDPFGGAVIVGNGLVCVAGLPLCFGGPAPTPADVAIVGYLGAIQIGLAYVVLSRGIRGVHALEASLLLLVEPVLSTGFAWLVLAERPGTVGGLGCALILACVLAHTVRDRSPVRET